MTDQEFDEVLSESSQESVPKKGPCRKSWCDGAKEKTTATDASWMEPTDYDSNEDSDYASSKAEGSDNSGTLERWMWRVMESHWT